MPMRAFTLIRYLSFIIIIYFTLATVSHINSISKTDISNAYASFHPYTLFVIYYYYLFHISHCYFTIT